MKVCFRKSINKKGGSVVKGGIRFVFVSVNRSHNRSYEGGIVVFPWTHSLIE